MKKNLKPRDLTPKQRAFVNAFLSNGEDAAKAYREVYSQVANNNTCSIEGRRLLRHPLIAPLVAEARAMGARQISAVMDRYAVTVERVKGELARIAFANMLDYMRIDDDGQPHFDASKLTPAQAAAIQEITVEEFMDGKGEDARPVRRTRFKLHPKRDALVDLGKHLGMFGEDPGRGVLVETAETTKLRQELRDMFASAIEANAPMKALMHQAVVSETAPDLPGEVSRASAPAARPVIDVVPEPASNLPGKIPARDLPGEVKAGPDLPRAQEPAADLRGKKALADLSF